MYHLEVKQVNILIFQSIMHEYASELTTTPKAELFCSCKRRKIIGQNQNNIKICKL